MSYVNLKNKLRRSESGDFIRGGVRIWTEETKQMTYLKNRYTLCLPAYEIPYASVLNNNSRVRKEVFMLKVEDPSQQNINGIYEKDIVKYECDGQIYEGIVMYNTKQKIWVIANDIKTTAFCKAKNAIVIGNIYEN